MPQLDEFGHVPNQLLRREDGPSWKQAAIDCGVDPATVEARHQAIEELHDLREWLQNAVEEYAIAIGKELEFCPWSEPSQIAPAGDEVVDLAARFVAAAHKARALIEGRAR